MEIALLISLVVTLMPTHCGAGRTILECKVKANHAQLHYCQHLLLDFIWPSAGVLCNAGDGLGALDMQVLYH